MHRLRSYITENMALKKVYTLDANTALGCAWYRITLSATPPHAIISVIHSQQC